MRKCQVLSRSFCLSVSLSVPLCVCASEAATEEGGDVDSEKIKEEEEEKKSTAEEVADISIKIIRL